MGEVNAHRGGYSSCIEFWAGRIYLNQRPRSRTTRNPPARHHPGYVLMHMAHLKMTHQGLALILTGARNSWLAQSLARPIPNIQRSTQSVRSSTNRRADSPSILASFHGTEGRKAWFHRVQSITSHGDLSARVIRTSLLAAPARQRKKSNSRAGGDNSLGRIGIERIGVQPSFDEAHDNSDDPDHDVCVLPVKICRNWHNPLMMAATRT